MKRPENKIIKRASNEERANQSQLYELFKKCPIPEDELLSNLDLFIKRQDLRRILFMNEIYKKIIDVHGIIIEFGVRWGRNLSLFESFRGIYEPYNYNRKIVGFDTFEGFPYVHSKDGISEMISIGGHSVTENYDVYLTKILDCHEQESPVSNIKKYRVIKGNAIEELNKYLNANPETIIALAYFDFDLYEPTKKCLEMISGSLTKGSVIAFDELNFENFPGETVAVKEVLGLDRYHIKRNCFSSLQSYMVIE